MTPRDRQLAAIRHEPADRVSVDSMAVENAEAIAAAVGIDSADVIEHLGLDGRCVGTAYTGARPPARDGYEPTEWGTYRTGDYSGAFDRPLAAATAIAEVERFAWPSADDYDYPAAAVKAQQLCDRYAVRGPSWSPLFCRVCDLFGMEQAMMHMLTEPALFDAAMARVTDIVVERCARLLDACGDAMPIMTMGDDFATQRGLMVSPDAWRKHIKPHLARVFAVAKSRGRFMWFHSCGDITSVLPDLIDIGMDVWETVQLHTLPMPPEVLKREYGRHITFFGGISTQKLPFMTPDEVRAEVRRVIGLFGGGGGYICGPDHHVKPDVPAANALALFDEARATMQLHQSS